MSGLDGAFGKRGARNPDDGSHWLSVSDLMAGLMVIFLFLAIAYMQEVRRDRDQITDIAATYQETKTLIFNALLEEFEEDLRGWDASIDSVLLAFEFRSPEVLFEQGQVQIRARFEQILSEFFPRYIATIEPFAGQIDEVRVEGHTSTDWAGVTDPAEAYFMNMRLSQGRTLTVLRYAYDLPDVRPRRDWIRSTFAAVGFSSSRPILDNQGAEDPERSRRVGFRIITNAERQIERILSGDRP
jgi:outer membrane protein OmpA-like peptidoglycan-associated protein